MTSVIDSDLIQQHSNGMRIYEIKQHNLKQRHILLIVIILHNILLQFIQLHCHLFHLKQQSKEKD